MKKIFFYIIILSALSGSCQEQKKNVPFNSREIYYEGRIVYKTDAAELSWPGTSVSISFEGKGISATLKDLDTANYYNVIVDDKVIAKIHTDTLKRTYILASDLPGGKHKVELFKRTEWDKGKTLFYSFEIPGKAIVLPLPAAKKRKMEFYGNSITCAYSVEDNSGKDSWYGYFQNGYLSYAALTARHFDAQFHSISKSGIGIMLSWFPLIMPEMYNRLDPTDSTSKWDFSKYAPDIVVINLFQNDSWLVNMHTNEQFVNRFGNKQPDESYIIVSVHY